MISFLENQTLQNHSLSTSTISIEHLKNRLYIWDHRSPLSQTDCQLAPLAELVCIGVQWGVGTIV